MQQLCPKLSPEQWTGKQPLSSERSWPHSPTRTGPLASTQALGCAGDWEAEVEGPASCSWPLGAMTPHPGDSMWTLEASE